MFCLISVAQVSTTYSSSLTNSSATITRPFGSGTYYYEALQVTVTIPGAYVFTSGSPINTYGYLYIDSITPSNLSVNMLIHNDDSGGAGQFSFGYSLVANRSYVLLFTTFSPIVTGNFSLFVQGPSMATIHRIYLGTPPNTTSPGKCSILLIL